MEQEDYSVQREHPRFAAVLKVTYKDARALADYTENLSEGGVFIATELDLKTNDRVSFEISFPGLVKPIRQTGVVVWQRNRASLSAEETQGVGIRLEFSSEIERCWLRDLLRRFASSTSGESSAAGGEGPAFTVLLAEDNPSFSRLISDALAGFSIPGRGGLKVIGVETAVDAQRALEAEAIDLVIAEWRLCRQAGCDLMKVLRSRTEETRHKTLSVVLGTSPDDQRAAAQSGADVFLRRPFPAKGLLATLRALVAPAVS